MATRLRSYDRGDEFEAPDKASQRESGEFFPTGGVDGGGDDVLGTPSELQPQRLGETPRESSTLQGGDSPYTGPKDLTLRAPSTATPPQPSSPQPQAGSVMNQSTASMQAPPVSPLLPFSPMSGPSPNIMARAPRGSLYGTMGGLTGGGLGMAQDPTSNQKSDPISTLIQMLQGRKGTL